jgi:hypothetical protein
MIAFLFAGARGVKRGNPNARAGINIGFLTDYSKMQIERLYGVPDTPFDYIGLDGYMGSWQPGGPEDWVTYIDNAVAFAGKPAIINEWGYSSLSRGAAADDPERKKHYNQEVCATMAWSHVWRTAHSLEEQAEYIGAALEIFAAHPQVIGNFFFKWSDDATCWQCGRAGCPAECAWGLVDVNGKPKPAYYAYKAGAVGAKQGGEVQTARGAAFNSDRFECFA